VEQETKKKFKILLVHIRRKVFFINMGVGVAFPGPFRKKTAGHPAEGGNVHAFPGFTPRGNV